MTTRDTLDPSTPPLRLGFLPLLDCAPLVIAQELGFYRQEGLSVRLVRESSWATLRDKVVFGLLDGAHMLAPMPLASSLGLGSVHKPLITALGLGLNGNAISLSTHLYQQLQDITGQSRPAPLPAAQALKRYLFQQEADKPLTLATVFPFSMHNYQLRHWLAQGGIDPDRDLNLVVVPPAMMVSALASGEINGFCVGEPYNAMAVRAGVGRIALTGHDIWAHAPEKVFGVTEDWAARHPETHHKLLRALLRACQWLDEPENRSALAGVLTESRFMDIDQKTLEVAVAQMASHQGRVTDSNNLLPCTHKYFYRHGATVPTLLQARWVADQMLRWGQASQPVSEAALNRVYRTDVYDSVANSLGLPTAEAQETCSDFNPGRAGPS